MKQYVHYSCTLVMISVCDPKVAGWRLWRWVLGSALNTHHHSAADNLVFTNLNVVILLFIRYIIWLCSYEIFGKASWPQVLTVLIERFRFIARRILLLLWFSVQHSAAHAPVWENPGSYLLSDTKETPYNTYTVACHLQKSSIVSQRFALCLAHNAVKKRIW